MKKLLNYLTFLNGMKDNHLVELIVTLNAKYIITYNKKDFLNTQLKFNFEIITAKEFLKRRNYECCNI